MPRILLVFATLVVCVSANPPPVAAQRDASPRAAAKSSGTAAAASIPPRLTYYGGPVLSNVKISLIFWNDSAAVSFATQLPQFYQVITDSEYLDWLGEYDTPTQLVGRGSYLGASTATGAKVGSITDANIQTQLISMIKSGQVPSDDPANTLYMFHFPPGMSISQGGSQSCVQFCSYHGTATYNGQTIQYGVIPDQNADGCESGCGSGTPFENTTSTATHELLNAITDPSVGLATTLAPPLAWYDDNNGEIADICAGSADDTDVVQGFTVAKGWSNQQQACVVRKAATLAADYRFQGDLISSAGTAPALADLGPGTNAFVADAVDGESRTVLAFPKDNGIALSPATGVIPSDEYSIVMLLRLGSVDGYRRLVDFDDGQSDCGFYVLNGTLSFFCAAGVGTGAIAPDTYVQVVLTRDNAGRVAGYVDGVQELSFTDSSSLAVLDANHVLRFFRDNECVAPCGEDSAGSVARLRLYDGALSASQVAALDRLAPSLDHFLCHTVAPVKAKLGQPPFPRFTARPVSLEDAFGGPLTFDLTRPLSLCTPASTNDADPAVKDHLGGEESYAAKRVKGDPKFDRAGEVHAIANHFQPGGFMVRLIAEDRLFVPSTEALGTGGVADLPPAGLDHFKCYTIAPARAPRGQPPFPMFTTIGDVKVEDQFGARLVDLKKLSRLCSPVDVNGEDASVVAHAGHLVCYVVQLTRTDPKQDKVPGEAVSTRNQFGSEVLQTAALQELCVPSSLDQ